MGVKNENDLSPSTTVQVRGAWQSDVPKDTDFFCFLLVNASGLEYIKRDVCQGFVMGIHTEGESVTRAQIHQH